MSQVVFPPFPVPEDLALRAKQKGWPDDLVQRAVNLRYERMHIEQWLSPPDSATPQVVAQLDDAFQRMERLRFGTLRARSLMASDLDGFSELWSNSTEEIGEWDVVVERGPNAVAQFRLQDSVEVNILEDRTIVIACVVWAHRNVVVGGEELYILCTQGLRVHDGLRRQGLSSVMRTAGRSPLFNNVNAEMAYMRSLNWGVVEMLKRTSPTWYVAQAKRDDDVPGVPVTVHQFVPPAGAPASASGASESIRPGTRDDLDACAQLINATHGHLDLYEPLSPWLLGHRLDEFRRGRRMARWAHVYGWREFRVVEENGEIVACGGLWDRGKHVRERWTHRESGDTRTIAATNVLDFGWKAGREDAMERLLRTFLAESARRERTYMVVPLQHHPELLARLADVECVPETRGLQWRMYSPEDHREMPDPQPRVVDPFTDLRYW